MGLHLSQGLFHLAQNSNRIGNQIGRAIALELRDQRSLALNLQTLLENVLFADLDCRFGGCSRVAHVIETPATRVPFPRRYQRTKTIAETFSYQWPRISFSCFGSAAVLR
jgi:hypothetical protein